MSALRGDLRAPTPLPAQISGLLDAFVADGGASAAGACVVRGDGRAFAHVVGRTRAVCADGAGGYRADPGRGVDLDTPFDLASLSKPLGTTNLLAACVAEGRLNLDDPVGRWLPDAPAPVAHWPLRLLLGHASGWPAWLDFAADVGDRDDAAAAAGLRAAVLATPAEAPPGERAVYSDLGFLTLGWVLEAATGLPLDAAHRTRFADRGLLRGLRYGGPGTPGEGAADPCVATEVWPRRSVGGRALCGVVHDDNAAVLRGIAGHAGLFGSVRAVAGAAAHWLAAVGHGVDAHDGALPATLARAWVNTAAAPETTWRLGWDTPSRPTSTAGSRASGRAFGHLGFVGTSVWVDPERDAAVVLLTNRVHPTREATAAIRALRPALHDAIWHAIDAQTLD